MTEHARTRRLEFGYCSALHPGPLYSVWTVQPPLATLYCFLVLQPLQLVCFCHVYLKISALELVGGCDTDLFFNGLSRNINSYLCLSLAACHTRPRDMDSLCLLGAYLPKCKCETGTATERAPVPADVEREQHACLAHVQAVAISAGHLVTV